MIKIEYLDAAPDIKKAIEFACGHEIMLISFAYDGAVFVVEGDGANRKKVVFSDYVKNEFTGNLLLHTVYKGGKLYISIIKKEFA